MCVLWELDPNHAAASCRDTSVHIKQHVMWCIWHEDFALFLSMIIYFLRPRRKLKSVLSLYYCHSNTTNGTRLSVCFWCLWLMKHLLTSFTTGISLSLVIWNIFIHLVSSGCDHFHMVFLSPYGEIGPPKDNRFVCDVQSFIKPKRCVSEDADRTKQRQSVSQRSTSSQSWDWGHKSYLVIMRLYIKKSPSLQSEKHL